jgi:hypothetical protein
MVADTKQASSATTAVAFITVGSLMVVWSSVYYFYLSRREVSDIHYLWDYGFFFSGLVLIAIGVGLGRIGKVARPAEVTSKPTGQPATAPGAPQTPPANATAANAAPVAAIPAVPAATPANAASATPPANAAAPVAAIPAPRQTT